ncbi:phosphotransferase [Leptolyngbya cf. ectocarpi LEGE 11479]|uniref:Phosphotransferase n=1 Tax=Leptolyngbya cf. ectocarpi LEGE 11479 TaxID=1828722 RepID=A0A928ZX67_LEPEC|nr:phosphotransferase [Leptolyngbya ectocarpi]MBE9069045.1 phosphotransferase [Leptolyngbya cf. ectocarpi LEGE 11479]
MSDFVVQVYKNASSNKAPTIHLPTNLPSQELTNPQLVKAAQGLFETSGVLLIKNLFSKELITNLQTSFVERYQVYFEDKDYADALKVGDKRRMLTVDIAPPFNNPDLYGNPFLLHLMRSLLGTGFVLGSFGAVISLPGSKAQHVHRDHPSLFDNEELDTQIPSFAITLVIPLVDLTPETGSTRVWKGSHRQYSSQNLSRQDADTPYVSTGSCYLMDYQLLHGGTANVSNQVRPILYLNYYRSWFQEAVNYEQQARILLTKQEYQKIPEPYKFLFERQRESLGLQQTLPAVGSNRTYKEFEQLTSAEQSKTLGELAKIALASYGFKQAQLKLITHGDNTVFSVVVPELTSEISADSPYVSNRFVLRIHRASYLSHEAIASELVWLRSLAAKLPVPEPIPTLDQKLWTIARTSDISDRVCSLTRWIKGASLLDQARPSNLQDIELVGQLIGKMHDHAHRWSPPDTFTRPSWNWNGLFGEGAGYSNNGARVWELMPQAYRGLFETVSKQVKHTMASLGEERHQFGLIHGDLWLGNLLVSNRQICPIDFADCGYGYWGYDLARFLSYFSQSQRFEQCCEKLLSGYTQVRAFPKEQLPHIATFMAAQQVTLALWRVNRAQDHPSFRSTLAADLQETATEVETFLAQEGS